MLKQKLIIFSILICFIINPVLGIENETSEHLNILNEEVENESLTFTELSLKIIAISLFVGIVAFVYCFIIYDYRL